MTIGLIVLLSGALINALAASAYKKGKITDLKQYVKVKMAGVSVSIIGLILMIILNQ